MGSETPQSPSHTYVERADNKADDQSCPEDPPRKQDDAGPAIDAHMHRLEDDLCQYRMPARRNEVECCQELQMRDENIKRLNDTVAKLREENQELRSLVVGAQESALESMLRKTGWSPKEDSLIQEDLSKLETALRKWARDHSVSALADLDHFSRSDKNLILGQLDGYCIWSEWQTLIEKLPIPRNKIPAVLLQSLLARDIFEWAFADPFFAFAEIEGAPALPKPNEWGNLYRTLVEGEALISIETYILLDANQNAYYQVHDAEAHIWRSQTLRILSTVANPGTEFRIAKRIRQLADRKAASFLISPATQLLQRVSSPGRQSQRSQELLVLYRTAAELALSLWTQRTFMKPYSLRGLPMFHISEPMMVAHRLHRLEEDDIRLDGNDVLLCVQPAILAFGNEDAENYDCYKVWTPATVVVDERS
ncbi:uncharacterized protein GIQ15_04785 [Arthroderma uncinatum]|uniref:uncharacterized protein n=1 Tax=Arthroderma uncinatum TaxID=74035 RepID=UPI00144A9DE0|nr:uncharacterized protein GIQ15_04785 [Arthroderma uncinatum]KAF3482026.1 hypothetical protein GIQ15_04785 [Arthroderma uncinatum]